MRKEGREQLLGNCTADQHLGFSYIDSIIPLLPKLNGSSLYPSVAVQPHLDLVRYPKDSFSHDVIYIYSNNRVITAKANVSEY